MKKILYSSIFFFSLNAFGADSGIDPTELSIKVFQMSASTSADCSGMTTIFEDSDADYQNILGSPNLGSGALADGTYSCVAIEMSDVIKYKPAETSTSGNCVANQEETMDVCDGGGNFEMTDGTTGTCGSAEQRVTIWLSTGSGSSGDGFLQPDSTSDSSKGFVLGSALAVSGNTSGSFVVNGTGRVQDDGSNCDMQPPAFSFSQ